MINNRANNYFSKISSKKDGIDGYNAQPNNKAKRNFEINFLGLCSHPSSHKKSFHRKFLKDIRRTLINFINF